MRAPMGEFSVRGRTAALLIVVLVLAASFVTFEVAISNGPVIQSRGIHLTYSGRQAPITGFDAYGLATLWGSNRGCGGQFSDQQLATLFSRLPPRSVVRFDAFEGGLGVNPKTDQIDFTGLDRVFRAAEQHGIQLVPVLANEWGGCDDGAYKDLAWYQSGWQQTPSASLASADQLPAPPLSYHDWVHAVVSREAEAGTCAASTLSDGCAGHITCPDPAAAASALRSFFDQVGVEIKLLDPTHLVEAGMIGGDQCGVAGNLYQEVISSPEIDVASIHDYLPDLTLGGPMGSTFSDRVVQAHQLNKPIIDGETGVDAATKKLGGGTAKCRTFAQRASFIRSQAALQFSQGVAGVLVWNLEPNPMSSCSLGVLLTDPVVRNLPPKAFSPQIAQW
jgi:mannan endo-1,4-beta-mannosidase